MLNMERTIIIHSTKQDALNLALILGKLTYTEDGEQGLVVPEWIELMYIHGKE